MSGLSRYYTALKPGPYPPLVEVAADHDQATGTRLFLCPVRAARDHLEQVVHGLDNVLAPISRNGHDPFYPENFLAGEGRGVLPLC